MTFGQHLAIDGNPILMDGYTMDLGNGANPAITDDQSELLPG
ncbi:hypothetical protein [Nocardia gipuzkoensis]|nr:hypothetical protein [Nocardia gipuzkoensis]